MKKSDILKNLTRELKKNKSLEKQAAAMLIRILRLKPKGLAVRMRALPEILKQLDVLMEETQFNNLNTKELNLMASRQEIEISVGDVVCLTDDPVGLHYIVTDIYIPLAEGEGVRTRYDAEKFHVHMERVEFIDGAWIGAFWSNAFERIGTPSTLGSLVVPIQPTVRLSAEDLSSNSKERLRWVLSRHDGLSWLKGQVHQADRNEEEGTAKVNAMAESIDQSSCDIDEFAKLLKSKLEKAGVDLSESADDVIAKALAKQMVPFAHPEFCFKEGDIVLIEFKDTAVPQYSVFVEISWPNEELLHLDGGIVTLFGSDAPRCSRRSLSGVKSMTLAMGADVHGLQTDGGAEDFLLCAIAQMENLRLGIGPFSPNYIDRHPMRWDRDVFDDGD